MGSHSLSVEGILRSPGSVDDQETYSPCLSRASSRRSEYIGWAGAAFGCAESKRGLNCELGRSEKKHRPREMENEQRNTAQLEVLGLLTRTFIRSTVTITYGLYNGFNTRPPSSHGCSKVSTSHFRELPSFAANKCEIYFSVYQCPRGT